MVESGSESYPLKRRDVARALLAERNDMLVVAGLGSTAWDATAAATTHLRSRCGVRWGVR